MEKEEKKIKLKIKMNIEKNRKLKEEKIRIYYRHKK